MRLSRYPSALPPIKIQVECLLVGKCKRSLLRDSLQTIAKDRLQARPGRLKQQG
jgi:hypothetical protein